MKRTVIRKRSRVSASYEKKPVNPSAYQFLAIAFLIIVGIVFGAVLAKNTGLVNQSGFRFFIQDILSKSTASKGFSGLFLSAFFSSSVLLCAVFFLGLCAFGQPGNLIAPIYKGAGIGLSMSYVYIQYGLKGFGICSVFILPQAILSSLSIMIACREGIRFSNRMAGMIFRRGTQESLWPEFCDYCFKFVFCFVLILAAAVIETLSTICFSNIFFS